MPAQVKNNILHYEGCNYLRYRLILSTLAGKPVRITCIRPADNDPGLREYEISFVRLLDKITNGSRIELNETGTSLYYSPGLLVGGQLDHDCSLQRGIGYYLEAVICLAPFCKSSLSIKLRGVTNNNDDPSVDRIKTACIPVLKRFLAGDNEVTFNINRRGVAPLGGGEIYFKCPISKFVKSIQCLNSGMVKRIRGTACSLRVSPAISNRLVESAKGVLLQFIPDIYIYTDASRGASSGKSPGFGISLTAETTTETFYNGEAYSPLMTAGSLPCVPEDLGKEAALKLLDEIYRNGCIDSAFQSMTALFMALGKKDVSKIIVGPLTPATIQFLRDLKDFFGITFKLENYKDEENIEQRQILLTCIGIGYSNISRRVF
ncbi:PREDICTED: RNA 3'-terminal phosphate cyclase-like protein [Ceratosolen solmsi marchali]|uniref:RNA 3'-terminal phosphate cyclase-like protein n=1 Tax=Ceratosolen solmsi marchali TaxID=326594 RepID=A0AAJ7DXA5_9HYME|nr:PREDICTED: RNA 3'-terminal phosphate cyclase-like protein [Ceratosolen solmsi marchali]